MPSKTSIFLLSDKHIYHPWFISEALDHCKQAPQNYSLIDPKCTFYCLQFPNYILNYSPSTLGRVKCHCVKSTRFPLLPSVREVLHSFNPESDFTGLKFWTCSTTRYCPLRKPETMAGIHSKFPHSTRHFWRALQSLLQRNSYYVYICLKLATLFYFPQYSSQTSELTFSVHRLKEKKKKKAVFANYTSWKEFGSV